MARAADTQTPPEAPSEPDLAHFVQRRRLDQYEQAIARQGYAYGVDVRRAQWLARSSLGNAAVRAVDRGWTSLSKSLMEHELDSAGLKLPRKILGRLKQLRALLSAPTPALWTLRAPPIAGANAEAPGPNPSDTPWAPVTPLGPARGGARWLVIDQAALTRLEPATQDFWLAAGLAHLQCGHAVFYTAHRLVARGDAPRRVQMLRQLAKPWSRVMAFSSDRAGLLACESLEAALLALEEVHEQESRLAWLPKSPTLELRRQALVEFERSVVVARVRAARLHRGQSARVVIPPRSPAAEAGEQAGDAKGGAAADQADVPPADLPPFVPADAWSLARCDQRLTERLRLL